MISLLDTPGHHLVDVWLCFYDIPEWRRKSWLWSLLEPGFSHVEAWRLDRGAWARVDTCLELMSAEVRLQPPWEVLPGAKFLHVVRLVPLGKVREPFLFGPVTCVELCKAMVGLRAVTVRTPFALYNHLRKSECSSSDSGWLRRSLWRFQKLLRSFVARLTSSGRANDEISEQAEGRSFGRSDAGASDRGSGEAGRAGEHQDQAHVERFPRHPYVLGITAIARSTVEHRR